MPRSGEVNAGHFLRPLLAQCNLAPQAATPKIQSTPVTLVTTSGTALQFPAGQCKSGIKEEAAPVPPPPKDVLVAKYRINISNFCHKPCLGSGGEWGQGTGDLTGSLQEGFSPSPFSGRRALSQPIPGPSFSPAAWAFLRFLPGISGQLGGQLFALSARPTARQQQPSTLFAD